MYSRITGYYRPVKNWNDGKSQEFRDRVVYDIGASKLVKGDAAVAARATESTGVAERGGEAVAVAGAPSAEAASAPDVASSTLPARCV